MFDFVHFFYIYLPIPITTLYIFCEPLYCYKRRYYFHCISDKSNESLRFFKTKLIVTKSSQSYLYLFSVYYDVLIFMKVTGTRIILTAVTNDTYLDIWHSSWNFTCQSSKINFVLISTKTLSKQIHMFTIKHKNTRKQPYKLLPT